jgi:HTH-type transcriptional regulator/antitoxin HigA
MSDSLVRICNMTRSMQRQYEETEMNITPIRTKKDYARTLKRVEKLMGAKANTKELDELDVLATLVDAYEEKHFPIDDPDPIAAIKHQMEAMGMSRKDLEPLLGSRSRVSEILNRKRKLTMDMVRNLHDRLGIPAGTLIRDYEVRA